MKNTTVWMMALYMLGATACADRMNQGSSGGSGYSSGSGGTGGSASTSGSGYAPGSASTSGGTGSSGSMGSGTGSASGSGSMMAGPGTQQAQASYGVVQAIDQLQRQDVGVSAMGASGAAAAGGTMGGSPTDKVYRITLRMDDGSSQMIVEESMPGYKIGDRVRYSNGSVQAY
ncbi:Sericin-1, putative [Ricinus communis]|uniref:Sericin-1, putative n=1 Tax=Ricinus communis TaxID=3988 RepID=B9T8Q3_RICCO|nr:Sericin-1, putative [Ricinus communis]